MYSDTLPKQGDPINTLLYKWAQLTNALDAVAGPPIQGDSDNQLLFKICMAFSHNCPAADAAPRVGDSDEILLAKILKCTSTCP